MKTETDKDIKEIQRLKALVKSLQQELAEKDELIKMLVTQADMTKDFTEAAIHAENYRKAIEEAREVKQKYDELYQELLKIKPLYLKAVYGLIDEL